MIINKDKMKKEYEALSNEEKKQRKAKLENSHTYKTCAKDIEFLKEHSQPNLNNYNQLPITGFGTKKTKLNKLKNWAIMIGVIASIIAAIYTALTYYSSV